MILGLLLFIAQSTAPPNLPVQATPPPTLEQQLDAANKRIAWLEQVLAQTQAKLEGIARYYTADQILMQLKAVEPVPLPLKQKEPGK